MHLKKEKDISISSYYFNLKLHLSIIFILKMSMCNVALSIKLLVAHISFST